MPTKETAAEVLGQSIAPEIDSLIQNTPAEIRGNFLKVVAFQVVLRIGWIFKTESIVMPAVMDMIGGPGWLRGCLPVLNRFGQSVPPLLASGFVTRTPFKKRVLSASAIMMGISFLVLALIWFVTEGNAWWLPMAFLFLYGIFFVSVGILNLVLSTLIGKVILTQRRGRLMFTANIIGATCAIFCAWYLLREWIQPESGNFANVFAFSGIAFVIAGLLVLWLRETPDGSDQERFSPKRIVVEALLVLKQDKDFRLLSIVGALFGLSLTLFPHYQAIGRDRLQLGFDALVPWLIIQNIGAAGFSVPAGWLADRFGNRLVLRLALGGLCFAPILAIVLSAQGSSASTQFMSVFFLLGLTPVTFRIFSNYTLELSGRHDHARYLSTLSLCIAVPTMILSPLLGLAVDLIDFEPVFILIAICLLIAWLLTIFLREPRSNSALAKPESL